jgi:DNA repair protein RadC
MIINYVHVMPVVCSGQNPPARNFVEYPMTQCIREMEPSQRPRERLLEFGARALSDAELLAVLIRTGRPGHNAVVEAHGLLADVGGLAGVARLDRHELAARPGIGPAKIATVMAAVELGQRFARAAVQAAKRLDQPHIAGEFLVSRMQPETREIFGFISLDGRHRFLANHELSLGTRTQAPVDGAELFRLALLDRASGVLLYHNHPSGDLAPSRDDIDLTRRLVLGGTLVGVSVHDHFIVAAGRWLSLRSARAEIFSG